MWVDPKYKRGDNVAADAELASEVFEKQEESAPMTDLERSELIGYGLILAQLLQSERFKTFFSCNYDLVKIVDDMTKTITMNVLEVPPNLVPERMKKMIVDAQKDQPMIEVISAETLKKL